MGSQRCTFNSQYIGKGNLSEDPQEDHDDAPERKGNLSEDQEDHDDAP